MTLFPLYLKNQTPHDSAISDFFILRTSGLFFITVRHLLRPHALSGADIGGQAGLPPPPSLSNKKRKREKEKDKKDKKGEKKSERGKEKGKKRKKEKKKGS